MRKNNNNDTRTISKKKLYNSLFQIDHIIPLDFININVVGGCNFKCKICHTWKDVKTKISLESCERFLKCISPFMKKDNTTFCFGGGEPLLHNKICDLIILARNYGYKPSIITNGWLITKSIAEKLIDAGLGAIMISLDSNTESVHDNIRGMKGSYKKIMNAIDLLDSIKTENSSNISIGITTTVNALNLSTIPNLVEWVRKSKKINHIRFQVVTQVFNTKPIDEWYLDDRYSFLWPKDKHLIKEIYSELINMKKKGYPIESSERNLITQKEYFLNPNVKAKHSLCGFYKSIFVEVNGNISMCMLNKPVANINDENLKTIFFRLLIPKEQRYIIKCNKINCHYDMNCRFN